MAVSPEYRAWVLEQLRAFGPVTARSMFGGAGVYGDGRGMEYYEVPAEVLASPDELRHRAERRR